MFSQTFLGFIKICEIYIGFYFSVSPTVIAVPPTGGVTVKEGEDVTLQCEVTGNPMPTVIWSKKVMYSV